MNEPANAQRIVALTGEGGGLDLYCLEKDSVIHFVWDSIWQIPGDGGEEPKRTPGWRAQEYATVSAAIAAAPGYWIFLAPVFIREDLRDMLWKLASARLTQSKQPTEFFESCLARWERACGQRSRHD